jgi:shikimate 5-dehydrogenase
VVRALLVHDMMYADEPTAFVRWRRNTLRPGRRRISMLVEQAAEAYRWRG